MDEKTDESRASLVFKLRELENNVYMSYDFFHTDSQGADHHGKYQYPLLKEIHQQGLGDYNQFMRDFIAHYYAGNPENSDHDWYSHDHNDIYGDISDNLVFQYSQYNSGEMTADLVAQYYVRDPLQKLVELSSKDEFFAGLNQQYRVFEKKVIAKGF